MAGLVTSKFSGESMLVTAFHKEHGDCISKNPSAEVGCQKIGISSISLKNPGLTLRRMMMLGVVQSLTEPKRKVFEGSPRHHAQFRWARIPRDGYNPFQCVKKKSGWISWPSSLPRLGHVSWGDASFYLLADEDDVGQHYPIIHGVLRWFEFEFMRL